MEYRGRVSGGLLGDKHLKNGVQGWRSQNPSSCCLTSNFDFNFVHLCLDYMICVHDGPIYPRTRTIRAAILAAAALGVYVVHS